MIRPLAIIKTNSKLFKFSKFSKFSIKFLLNYLFKQFNQAFNQ